MGLKHPKSMRWLDLKNQGQQSTFSDSTIYGSSDGVRINMELALCYITLETVYSDQQGGPTLYYAYWRITITHFHAERSSLALCVTLKGRARRFHSVMMGRTQRHIQIDPDGYFVDKSLYLQVSQDDLQ